MGISDSKYKLELRIAKANALYNQVIVLIEDILAENGKTNKQKVEEIEDLMMDMMETKEKFD